MNEDAARGRIFMKQCFDEEIEGSTYHVISAALTIRIMRGRERAQVGTDAKLDLMSVVHAFRKESSARLARTMAYEET